jgi:Stage II sporulation protein E (SpoIIE)
VKVARAIRRGSVLGRLSSSVTLAAVLVTVALLLTWSMIEWPLVVSYAAYAPLVVVAGLFLPLRWFLAVLGVITVALGSVALDFAVRKPGLGGGVLILGLIAAMMGALCVSRSRLGVQGTLGESMLVDLRDRLRAHGVLPELPEPWHAEVALQSAYGDAFSGDFVVANRSGDGSRLEVALIDVSGKGVNAGTRALLLSGAFGGLLGAMEPEKFLPAANSYLLRQDWNEGFATAAHLAIDLETGVFCIGSAGHPPSVKFSAGSGRWGLLDATAGPLLGVMDGGDYPREVGRLERGDALLLYTDGVIETRTRDLNVGIDRMLGEAERLVSRGFSGGAARICATALAGETDDRAVVLIWRR